jgi:heme oxygenase (biliverdin-IX-beta and delta-forming)
MFADFLKERTKEAHASLEKKLVVRIKNVKSISDYTDLLLLLYPFHFRVSELLDSSLVNFPEEKPDPARAGNLVDDLEHFGRELEYESIDSMELPGVNSTEDAWGLLYVLEGSTMGGHVITNILSRSMNVPADKGFSFFNPYQSNTTANWENFKYQLNHAAGNLDQEKIIKAAIHFFTCYNQWIRLNEPVSQ